MSMNKHVSRFPLCSVLIAALALFVAACSTAPTTQPPTPIPSAPRIPDLSGEWILTTRSRVGTEQADMRVTQTGSALTGKLTSARGSVDYSGSINGDAVVFGFTLSGPGNNLKIDYSGTVEGDTMHGKTVIGNFGEGTFSAKRKGP